MQVKYPTVPTRICRHGERFICEARPRT
jgi:hypothetical protein